MMKIRLTQNEVCYLAEMMEVVVSTPLPLAADYSNMAEWAFQQTIVEWYAKHLNRKFFEKSVYSLPISPAQAAGIYSVARGALKGLPDGDAKMFMLRLAILLEEEMDSVPHAGALVRVDGQPRYALHREADGTIRRSEMRF